MSGVYITIDDYQELLNRNEAVKDQSYKIVNTVPSFNDPEIGDKKPRLSFSFDGFEFKDLLTIEKITNPIASDTKNNFIENTMMDGGIFIGSKREKKYITVHFNYVNDLMAMSDLLARYLITGELCELWLSNRPNRFYYAKVDGIIEPEEGPGYARGKVTFVIPDAVGYSIEHTRRNFETVDNVMLKNNATDDAYPVLDFTLKSRTYMIAISTAHAVYQFGEALEDAPKKEVPFSFDEVAGHVMVTRTAVPVSTNMNTAPPPNWTYFDISTIREEWASAGGRYDLTKDTKVVPVDGKVKIGMHALEWQTGEKIPQHLKGKTFTVAAQKPVNQSRSDIAYQLKDSTRYYGWLLEQDIEAQANLKGGIEPTYGTLVPRKWYGSSIATTIKGRPSNWQMDIRSSFKLGKHSEYGMQYMAVCSGTDVLFSLEITAHKKNRTVNIYLVANNRGIAFNQDPGGYFFKNFEGLITAKLMDGELTLELRNTVDNKFLSQAWSIPGITKAPDRLVLFNGRYENNPVPEKNFWNLAKFTGFDCEVWISPDDEFNVNGSDPQHVFQAGDVIRLDMNDNNAYVNGLPMLTPVQRASESTVIPPGEHEFIITTDDLGTKPTLEVNYRERWK